LAFLAIVVGGSLTLYAFRAPTVTSRVGFGKLSRELFLLLNNVVFLVATITILLGTLFPLIMDALDAGKYSVGPPYFNAVFVPLMAIVMVLMGPGIMSNWKQSDGHGLMKKLLPAALASIVIGLLFPFVYAGQFNLAIVLAVTLVAWLVLSMAVDLKHKLRNASSMREGLKKLSPSYYGMLIAHLGFAVSVMGVCITSHYSEEHDLRMVPDDKVTIGEFTYTFKGTELIQGANYQADQGRIEVYQGELFITELFPEKRRYSSQAGNMMTEAAIDAGLFRDLFVALGEELDSTDGAWAVRIHYKPFVRWIWLGSLLMALGGCIAVADKRYRLKQRANKPAQTVDTPAAMVSRAG
jgi:cytochrome c-type biogenesis protein CcmF